MKVEIKQIDGRPSLMIDGSITPPVIYGLSDFPGARANTYYAYKNVKNFAEQGIDLVNADASLCTGWHKATGFDPESISSEIEAVLDANPNAKIFLRLHLNAPYWWMRDNPDECAVYRKPAGDVPGIDDGEQDRLIRGDGDCHMRVSLASEKWKSEAAQRLVELLLALKDTRAGRGLIGIQVACGMFGEWHAWGRGEPDVSAPMQSFYKKFLKGKYGSVEALRAAHNDPTVDFDTVEYHPEAFAKHDDGNFRNPRISQRIIDSQKSNQKAVSDAILHFAKVVKETSPELLCGVFYAYYLCTGDTGVIGAHLNAAAILNSQYINYVCGPFCYMDNRLPDGVPMQRAFLESCRLHGKLWLTEMDQFPLGVEQCSGGTDENFDVNVAMLRRDTLQPVFGGHGFWFYDHRLVPTLKIVRDMGDTSSSVASIYRKRGWWDSPKMMNEIGKVYDFISEFGKRAYTSDADVLIVYDPGAKYYRYTQNPNAVEYALFEGIARCGVAYDCIYLEDLFICDIEKYKCVIFADCPVVNAELKARIKSIMATTVCVFMHGTGYCDGKKLSVNNMCETLGIKVKIMPEGATKLTLNAEQKVLPEPLPTICIEDTAARVLACAKNGEAIAAKLGNAIYVSSLYLTVDLAKTIIAQTDAHIWCESGEPVIAAAGCLLICAQREGERIITLPAGDEITISSKAYETLVIDTKDGDRIL